MRAVDVDDVKTGITGAQRGVHPCLLDALDVGCVHLFGQARPLHIGRDLARADAHRARLSVLALRAAVEQLETHECAEGVNGLDGGP